MLIQEALERIGSVAQKSGVPIKTIRYYEELGLLKSLGRTEGGFRLFDSNVLSRLSFIKRCQSLGLSLLEIKEFLDVHDRGDLPCDRVRIKLKDKIVAIDRQVQQLQTLKRELEELLASGETILDNSEETICPIIEQLP